MCGELEYASTSDSVHPCSILSSQTICESWGRTWHSTRLKFQQTKYPPLPKLNMVLTHFSLFFVEGANKSAPSMGGVGLPPNRWCTAGATHVAKRFCVFGTNRLANQRSRSPGDFLLEAANCDTSCGSPPCAFVFLSLIQGNCCLTGLVSRRQTSHVGKCFFRQTFNWEECHKRAGGAISSQRKRCQVVFQYLHNRINPNDRNEKPDQNLQLDMNIQASKRKWYVGSLGSVKLLASVSLLGLLAKIKV